MVSTLDSAAPAARPFVLGRSWDRRSAGTAGWESRLQPKLQPKLQPLPRDAAGETENFLTRVETVSTFILTYFPLHKRALRRFLQLYFIKICGDVASDLSLGGSPGYRPLSDGRGLELHRGRKAEPSLRERFVGKGA